MVDLRDVVGNLERLGFFDFVLPWLLFFALIRAILDKSGVVGDDKKITSIIAAVIAFFIVNFTPIGGISAFYSKTFGLGAQIIATLLIFVIFAGALGFKTYDKDGLFSDENHKKWIFIVIAIILAVFAFAVFAQASGGIGSIGLDNDTVTTILVLAFVLAVIFFAMNDK